MFSVNREISENVDYKYLENNENLVKNNSQLSISSNFTEYLLIILKNVFNNSRLF